MLKKAFCASTPNLHKLERQLLSEGRCVTLERELISYTSENIKAYSFQPKFTAKKCRHWGLYRVRRAKSHPVWGLSQRGWLVAVMLL